MKVQPSSEEATLQEVTATDATASVVDSTPLASISVNLNNSSFQIYQLKFSQNLMNHNCLTDYLSI